MRVRDRIAVVTGAGSGIGRAGARALAREGAIVMVSDVVGSAAAETARMITDAGGRAASCETDAGSSAAVQALMAETAERWGGIDVLYNNAGIALPGQDGFTPSIEDEVWERLVRVNLTSVFLCSKYAIPHLARRPGAAIVNTASSMAVLPLGGMDGYAASKGAVASLTRSMAPGCGALGIRVNAICPGYVDTPMTATIFGDATFGRLFAAHHAMGKQDPEEIASLVVYLASDEARSLTGAVLTCDRGWTAFKCPDVLTGTAGDPTV